MDLTTNKPKGYGYIEFIDRDSLISAVRMDGESLQKRSIRINVAERERKVYILTYVKSLYFINI